MKRFLFICALALLVPLGVYAATVVTEEHAFSKSYTERVTVASKGKVNVYTQIGTVSGTITEQDTYPDPSTVTVTVTAPPTTNTEPPTTTTQPPPSGITLAPGQSWQTVYDNAPANSTITVLAGFHGLQRLVAGTKSIVFSGQDGAYMRQFYNEASNIVLDNVDIDGGAQKMTILEAHGSNNIYMNLEIRNNKDQQMVTNAGTNATYDNVFFHDAVLTSESSDVHMECVWSNGPAIKVRNSVFKDCAIMDLYLTLGTWWGQQPYTDVVVDDNVFWPSERAGNSGTHFYGFLVNGALPVNGWTIRRNDFKQSVDTPNPTNSIICGNFGIGAPSSWTAAC